MQFFLVLINVLALVSGESAWTETKTKYSGLVQVSLNSLKACSEICSYVENCNVAMMDSTTDPPCWLQTGPIEEIKNETVADGVRVFQFDRSVFKGEICWTKHEGKSLADLQPASFDNVFHCLLYCHGVRNCDAISFKPDAKPMCWVYVGVLGTFENPEFIPEPPTTTTYIFDKKCMLPEGI